MGEPPDLGLGTGVWVKGCDINLKHEECRRVTLLAKKRECFRPRDLKEQQPGSEQRLKHVIFLMSSRPLKETRKQRSVLS